MNVTLLSLFHSFANFIKPKQFTFILWPHMLLVSLEFVIKEYCLERSFCFLSINYRSYPLRCCFSLLICVKQWRPQIFLTLPLLSSAFTITPYSYKLQLTVMFCLLFIQVDFFYTWNFNLFKLRAPVFQFCFFSQFCF